MINRRKFLGSAAVAAISFPCALEIKPNLLVIFTDQYRFEAMSCAGNGIVKTPNLDRLARDGVMFQNAITPSPVCVPARTIILTGKSMHRNNATGNAAAETKLDCGPSFDNLLAERGYHTEYYGKYHSPYLMALTYKNKVSYAGAKFEGAPSERQQYLAYLDKHSPARPLKPRELISKEFNRSYIPAILDAHFPNPNDETRQGEVYGVADSQGAVPRGVYGG